MVTPDTSKKAKKFKNLDFLPIANSTFQQKTFDDEEEERLFYIQIENNASRELIGQDLNAYR